MNDLRVVHSRVITYVSPDISQIELEAERKDLESSTVHRRASRTMSVPFFHRPSNIFFVILITLLNGFLGVVYFFFPNFWNRSFEWPMGKQWVFGLLGAAASALAGAGTVVYRQFR
jgi:hypothetical protein